MVNPSTADEENDDATIRKLKGFGERNQWGRLIVGNLFAYRATDVRELGKVANPIGPDNALHLAKMFDEADRIIFAWGPIRKVPLQWQYTWRAVDYAVRSFVLKVPHSIGVPAKCGHPKHPLMLPYDSPIIPWSVP